METKQQKKEYEKKKKEIIDKIKEDLGRSDCFLFLGIGNDGTYGNFFVKNRGEFAVLLLEIEDVLKGLKKSYYDIGNYNKKITEDVGRIKKENVENYIG